MSNAPICHISTGSTITDQPKPTLLPSIPVAVDLPSAIAAINALKLLIQMISGQQGVIGSGGIRVTPLNLGGGGVASTGTTPGQNGQKGQNDSSSGRFVEQRNKRVVKKIRVFQDNDKTSENYVDIAQINQVVWVDNVTGELIVWTR